MATGTSSKFTGTKAHKFDPAEQYRTEILERTEQGETCEQIAAALRAKGVDITNKTISRRRVEWGVRKRPFSKLLGTRTQKPRPKKPFTKNAGSSKRKAEIKARTHHGETPEQIAEALIAQGYELKKGAGTVLRLQTFWGLIPHDEARARGRRKGGSAEGSAGAKAEKVSKREMEREANKLQQTQTLHYPTDCSFGPKKRVNGAAVDDNESVNMEMDFESQPLPILAPAGPLPVQQSQPSMSVAAEIMSVEFLVDLANSTLSAATNLKDMLLAYQEQRPASNSLSASPPTLEDLTTARRKVREAAAVMHDLAVEPSIQTAAN